MSQLNQSKETYQTHQQRNANRCRTSSFRPFDDDDSEYYILDWYGFHIYQITKSDLLKYRSMYENLPNRNKVQWWQEHCSAKGIDDFIEWSASRLSLAEWNKHVQDLCFLADNKIITRQEQLRYYMLLVYAAVHSLFGSDPYVHIRHCDSTQSLQLLKDERDENGAKIVERESLEVVPVYYHLYVEKCSIEKTQPKNLTRLKDLCLMPVVFKDVGTVDIKQRDPVVAVSSNQQIVSQENHKHTCYSDRSSNHKKRSSTRDSSIIDASEAGGLPSVADPSPSSCRKRVARRRQ